LVEAILSKLRKNGHHDQITVMMGANVIILISLPLFDIGAKYIAGFFLLVLF
jgi:hypothetical protein